ncbi:MAG TPA: isochorismatase family protein [Thermoanaerobaculia bacterium]|nr:isochorismatase family protein [Thermoanaerobaculia bacterium]
MSPDRRNSILVVIDVQERLMPVIHDADGVVRNLERLIRGCHLLGVPALLTEQYVKGLGPTVARVRSTFEETHGYRPIEKLTFSAMGVSAFAAQLAALERRHVLIAGVETHVCVYQTVRDLLAAGMQVTLVADALSSRSAENRELALRRMMSDGAKLGSTELALFELLATSGTDEFRAIATLVK